MFVCICKAVKQEELEEILHEGEASLSEVQNRCGAGTDCGACRSRITKILENLESSPQHAQED